MLTDSARQTVASDAIGSELDGWTLGIIHLYGDKVRYLCFLFSCLAWVSALAAVPAPERALTAPGELVSVSNGNAAPVPIVDLFYLRSNASIAWSPDGSKIVISTDLSGRLNLWQVESRGGWPVQLTRSDDRQRGAAWSPDGKWVVFESDRGAMNCSICSPYRRRVVTSSI
jgi:WD40 repeat protein